MTWYTSGTNQTAGDAAHVEPVMFVTLEFPSGVLRMHTRTGTIAWGGNDYLGVGKLGNIEAIQEDPQLRPSSVRLVLSGVDSALMSSAITEDYHGRPVVIYHGFMDTTTLALVANPETIFRGIMDYMTCDLGRNSGSIVVQCESEMALWARTRELSYTHESQQLVYPGDRFFDQVPFMQSKQIDWTKKGGVGQSVQVRISDGNKP
jgi:hypothetical protein